MQSNLNNLLCRLLENNIDFVLIGGYAGVVHGSSQVTKDLDICALIDPNQIEALRKALADLNPKHRMNPQHKPSFLTEPHFLGGVTNLYLETDIGVLDVISFVTGVGDFATVKKNAVTIRLFGHDCQVISVDDLIRAKETLARRKDLLVVEELKALHKK